MDRRHFLKSTALAAVAMATPRWLISAPSSPTKERNFTGRDRKSTRLNSSH